MMLTYSKTAYDFTDAAIACQFNAIHSLKILPFSAV
jgi:hypothetical protein